MGNDRKPKRQLERRQTQGLRQNYRRGLFQGKKNKFNVFPNERKESRFRECKVVSLCHLHLHILTLYAVWVSISWLRHPRGKPPGVRLQKKQITPYDSVQIYKWIVCCKDTKSNPSERRGEITPLAPVAPNAGSSCIYAPSQGIQGHALRWLFRRGDCHFLGLPVRRLHDLRSGEFVAVWFR